MKVQTQDRSSLHIYSSSTSYVTTNNVAAVTVTGQCPKSANYVTIGDPFFQDLVCTDQIFSGTFDLTTFSDNEYSIIIDSPSGVAAAWSFTKYTRVPTTLSTALDVVNGAYTVTVTFGTAVTGFVIGDISVTNGVPAHLLAVVELIPLRLLRAQQVM